MAADRQQDDAQHPFRTLWDLGYRRLVPVVPPGAEVAARGAFARRLAAGQDPRGKAPGVLRSDGTWSGFNFVAMESREDDLDTWASWGASAGIKTGDGLIAVDVDTRDRAAAEAIYKLAALHLGPGQVRFGEKPKCLMLYEAPKDTPYRSVTFSTPAGEREKVEILSEGRQFVAFGIHPRTKAPYAWPRGIPHRDHITKVSAEQVETFLRAVAAEMPHAVMTANATGEAPDQDALKAPSWEALAAAVEAMPNTDAMFPTRDDYVRIAYAIRAAAPDGCDYAARDLYLDWCDRWETERTDDNAVNDPAVAVEDWERAKGPFRVGYEFLLEHAPALFFQPQEADVVDDMFAASAASAAAAGDGPARSVTFEPLSALAGEEIRERDWIVPGLIPNSTVTMLSGDGGTGKSLLAIQLAIAAATARPWLEREVKPGPVVLISAEDDREELHRRFADVCRHYDVDLATIDNLHFLSLAGEDAVLGAPDRSGNGIRPTPLFHAVEARVSELQPVLVVLDTLADLYGGNEIDRIQTRQFVGILRGLAIRNACAALLLSHPSVAGMQSGSGISGSTAWNASVRSRLYLERITENGIEPNPDARRLSTKKANYARTGAAMNLLWAGGAFSAEEGTAGVLAGLEQSAKAQAAFLRMLREFNRQGRYVSANPGSTYAPSRFAKAGGEGFTARVLTDAMESLLRAGRVRMEEHGRASKRRYHLVEAEAVDMGFPEQGQDGVFE